MDDFRGGLQGFVTTKSPHRYPTAMYMACKRGGRVPLSLDEMFPLEGVGLTRGLAEERSKAPLDPAAEQRLAG